MAYKRSAQTARRSSAKRYKRTVRRVKRKSYRRKTTRGRGAFNKKVLAVIKRTAEPKVVHRVLQEFGPMYHNGWQVQKLYKRGNQIATFPPQGDGVHDRNGNEIYAKGFMIRGSFCLAGDRRGTTLRFYLLNAKEDSIPYTYDNVFQNITNNAALDPMDKTKFPHNTMIGSYRVPDRSAPTASYDGTFELIDTNIIFKKWIPFNKKIRFDPGTQDPTGINAYLAIGVSAYDHNSALETDICVKSLDLMSSFYYSDP